MTVVMAVLVSILKKYTIVLAALIWHSWNVVSTVINGTTAICIPDHAWDDSIIRFMKKAEEKRLNVLTPHISETVDFEYPDRYKGKWWTENK